jgi:hypothetical protein
MTTHTEPPVLGELRDVLEEYTCRQRELLNLVRRFRTAYLEVAPAPPVHLGVRPVAPAPVRVPVVAEAAAHRPLLTVVPAPPAPATAARDAGSVDVKTLRLRAAGAPGGWPADIIGSRARATKRDYDYFDELDRNLRRLGSPGDAS